MDKSLPDSPGLILGNPTVHPSQESKCGGSLNDQLVGGETSREEVQPVQHSGLDVSIWGVA